MGILVFGSGGGGNGGGLNWDEVDIQPQFALSGKKFFDKDKQLRAGTILNWDGTPLSGPSSDSSKVIITPDKDHAWHIPGGRYLGRDVEISAMGNGSASMSIAGNVVTLAKQAGYIDGGNETLNVPAGSATIARDGKRVTLTKEAGYIGDGSSYIDVPVSNQTKSKTITSNGTTEVLPDAGYDGLSKVTITTNVSSAPTLQNRTVSITANGTQTFYASSGYDGMYSCKVTVAVPTVSVLTGTGTVTTGDTVRTIKISCPSGYTLAMAGFVASSVPGTNYVVSGIVRYGSSTGRCDVQTSSGVAVGNSLTSVSFSGNMVTITCSSSYSFNGNSYTAYVAYYG